ncbi:hypothetical protein [Desulforamulus aquiferis]|uniref:Phage protein n=1 Tax=Desulforamulus aquiferis TaxID=1397668 RepID=A0AAW7ZCT3_9FIRM|nr:hypothetical protein [Desulforamulus aquiferis]MDO7787132.1 hypothetical protein [Desulforamulus aquiferis]
MAYKVRLTKGLSYSGIVNADRKNPITEVKSKKDLEEVLATGHFELVKAEEEKEDKGE